MSAPQSTIYLCSYVRLDNTYENTLFWELPSDQLAYFSTRVRKELSAYTYLRKSWSIKISVPFEESSKCNYLYFQNRTDGKYYFYFITDVEYINENCSELFLEMDVMQTYFFDYEIPSAFVERIHVTNDGIGAHTVDEGLELGEHLSTRLDVPDISELCVLLMATFDPLYTTKDETALVLGAKYHGVFSGLGIYAVDLSDWTSLANKLYVLDEAGKSDGVVTIWMYPKALVRLEGAETWNDGNAFHHVDGIEPMYAYYERIGRQGTNHIYTPRNNKLLTYPYSFLYVTNNSGSAAVYHFERFGDPSNCGFKLTGALSPDGAVKMYPLNYNGVSNNYESGLTLGGFPTCAWNQDVYKLWLAQNQNQQGLSMATGLLSIGAGAAVTALSGGLGAAAGVGMMASGASQIAGLMAQRADREIQPPQAKGSHSVSVNIASGYQEFTVQHKYLTSEMAQKIDDYFTRYGYKVNQMMVSVPRMTREEFTYIKTCGIEIAGSIPASDMVKIKQIFNNGVTFWWSPDHVGEYWWSNPPRQVYPQT